MCTESLLGVSEAQAVPGRVRAPGTVQTARQVALHRVTGGSLPRRRRLFSEGSRDAAPGRASEARSLSVRFPPPWQPCSPGLPEVRLRLLGQRDRTVSSASLPAGAAVHSGKCPKAVSWAAGRVQGSQCCRTCFSTSNHHCFFFSLLVFHRRATPTALRGRKKVSKAPLDVTSTCSSQASFPALFPFNPH